MSIRHFVNRPCEKCGTDTLHIHRTCTVCGWIPENPSDLRRTRNVRAYATAMEATGNDRYKAAAIVQSRAAKVHRQKTKWLHETGGRMIDQPSRRAKH